MALTNDEELFRHSCTELSLFSPVKSKALCDAHGQLQTAKTRDGYGLARLLKDVEKRYSTLIQNVGVTMSIPKRRSSETEEFPFFFYVDNVSNALKDSTQSLHFYICAYLEKGWTILRETQFDVSPLALLPYRYEYKAENEPVEKYHIGLKLIIPEISNSQYVSKEVTLDYLTKVDSLKLSCRCMNVPYDSQWSDGQYRQEFLCLAEFEQIDATICDDYGQVFNSYGENSQFSNKELPEELAEKTYTLLNKDVCAPLTTSNSVYCILYADKRNVVRVLRWLPVHKDDMHDKPLLPLHELGIVDQEQAEVLHTQLTDSQNTLLFGKVEDNEIQVICNINGYFASELRNFVLPLDLFNLAK